MEPAVSAVDGALLAGWRSAVEDLLAACRDQEDEGAGLDESEACRAALRSLRSRLRLVSAALADAADVHALLPGVREFAARVPALEQRVFALCADVAARLPAHSAMRREFYVYLHRAPDGSVFYVGKGRERRAWSRVRTDVWSRYVSERLGGRYDVVIHRDGLTHGEALALESELIRAYGAALVNWINPSRDIDAEALERARLLRAETLGRVGALQFMERVAPEEALQRYRRALADVRTYSRIPFERGLLGEMKDVDRRGDPIVLDRLTRCLERLGRADEIMRVAADYFREFPDAPRTPAGGRVSRRCERAAAGRLQRGHAGAGARMRRSRVLR